MKMAASHALAELVGDDLHAGFILPDALDKRVAPAVAAAVIEAARQTGVARL